MNPGTVIRMSKFTHRQPCGDGKHENQFGFNTRSRKVRFVAVLLGTETEEEPLDVEAAMNRIGWEVKE